jgi:TolB protein
VKKARTTRQLHRHEAKTRRRRARQAAAMAAMAAGALGASAGTAHAAFPGQNGLIAFDSDRQAATGTLDIFSVNPNSATPPTTATDLTPGSLSVEGQPTWSADGTMIAFTAVARGTATPVQQIWVMNADGSNPHVVTTSIGFNDSEPAWSPDVLHPKIAFAKGSPRLGNRDIYVVDVTTGAETQVTNDAADDANPTWSPDGRYIAFESSRITGTYDVWRVDAPTTINPAPEQNPTDLTPGTPSSNEQEPDYSPGSSFILFDSDRDNPAKDIYGKFANTSTFTYRLTTMQANTPGFSPDGRKFTFQSSRTDPQGDIYTQNLIVDTSTSANVQNVTATPGVIDETPDWQPIGGTCPATPPGSTTSNPALPPLPVDPGYPLTPTQVSSGTASSGGAADNDPQAGGSSDAGMGAGHPGDSSTGGTGGNPCPGGGNGFGSSDSGGGGQTGSTGS